MNNIQNQKFNKLLALKPLRSTHYGVIWKCLCDCGNTTEVVSAKLRNGQIKSCGCSWEENLIGKIYGRLTVISKHPQKKLWLCKCFCGKQRYVEGGHLKSGHTQSCGCLNKERVKQTLTKNLVGKKFNKLFVQHQDTNIHNKVYWVCRCDCGKRCSLPATSIVSGNTTSCGCVRKNQKKQNHPRWNPNISQEERELRPRRFNMEEHKIWRNKIFKRDNFTCQLSGQKGGQLVAHHIKSFADNKSERYKISNGITISRKLHIKFHRRYGYGNNTLRQFQLFKRYLKKNKFIA